MKPIIDDNHYFFTVAEDINEICRPLRILGITSFDYVRTFDDGSKINLCNNAEWLKKYYSNRFYTLGNFEKDPKKYSLGHTLWHTMDDQQVFSYGREYYDIDHGITLKKPAEDGKSCEFYFFGGPRKNVFLEEFFINNIELLEHFIFYFRDRAAGIIKNALKNRIYIPKVRVVMDGLSESPIDNANVNVSDLFSKFIKETRIRNFTIDYRGVDIHLTEKEYMVSLLLVSGYCPATIAEKIMRSIKTINRHIENIKEKFNCTKKDELINILLKSGFDQYNNGIIKITREFLKN